MVSTALVLSDRYFNLADKFAVSGSMGSWLFNDFLPLLLELLSSPIFFIIVIASLILKGVAIAYFAFDLSLQFKNLRTSAVQSALNLPIFSVLRFLGLQCVVYLLFGLIAFSVFFFCRTFFDQETGLWVVVGSFGVLYPVFYASLSIASFVSILPFPFSESVAKARNFMAGTNLLKTYLFYFIRSLVDYACLIIIPTAILLVTNDWLWSLILISLSLSLPIAFVRTSSFAFKLQILSPDVQIKKEYGSYYNNALFSAPDTVVLR